MEGNIIQFRNCRLVRKHELIRDDLWVRDGKIINPEPVFFDEKNSAHQQIDCLGAIIAPGFIDLQINGMTSVNSEMHRIIICVGIIVRRGYGTFINIYIYNL